MLKIRNTEDLANWLTSKPPEWFWSVSVRATFRQFLSIGLIFRQTEVLGPRLSRRALAEFNSLLQAIRLAKTKVDKNKSSVQFKLFANAPGKKTEFHQLVYEYIDLMNQQNSYTRAKGGKFRLNSTRSSLPGSSIYRISFVSGHSQSLMLKVLIAAINHDISALESGIDLWTQPLWLDDTPEWAIRGWETLATELTRRAPYWKTLVRWYEDRLHGDDWAAAQGRPAIPELEIARASLSDSYWKKGGRAVNEAIAKLEDYFWNGVEIDDPVLQRLVGEKDGTVGDIEVGEPDVEMPPEAIAPPPLPVQSNGPHFGLRDGLLDFAPPEHLDAAKNNVQRLRSLIPLLRAEVAGATEIFGRNKAHGRIHDALVSYSGLLEGEVMALNYDLLAGFGVKLQAEEAAAKEAIADGLEPAFERSETAALKSILDLHGPVILSTEAGQTFVADAERWERNPRQEKQFRQSASKLAEAIEADGIATPTTARFVKDAAADVGLGPQPERSAVFGVGTIRNVSIALVGSAVLYHPAEILLHSGVLQSIAGITQTAVGVGVGGIAGTLFYDGIKRSRPGIAVSDRVKDASDAAFDRETYRKFAIFVHIRWRELTAMAGTRREFKWLQDWLTWLKANPPTE